MVYINKLFTENFDGQMKHYPRCEAIVTLAHVYLSQNWVMLVAAS